MYLSIFISFHTITFLTRMVSARQTGAKTEFIFTAKTSILGLSVGEDFVILACVVLTRCQHVTDRRKDGRTTRS